MRTSTVVTVATVAVAFACSRAPGAGAPAPSSELPMSASQPRMLGPGELGPEQLGALAPRAARLVSDLDTLRARPGMPVSLEATLRIAVLDSAGALLGLMSSYDSRVEGTAFELDGRALTATAEGTGALRLEWPRSLWRGRADEPLAVSVPLLGASSVREEQLVLQGPAWSSGGHSCSPLLEEFVCVVHITEHFDMHDAEPREARIRRITLSRISPRASLSIDGGDTAAANAHERAVRATIRGIEDRGRSPSGRFDNAGRLIGFEHSKDGDTLFVAGQAFTSTWRRDSATVLLIDHRADPLAPTVRTLTIGSQLPDGLVRQQWTRGDTTFIVQPRDAQRRWRAFFDRFPRDRRVPAVTARRCESRQARISTASPWSRRRVTSHVCSVSSSRSR